MTKLSLIMPCYNCADTLEEAVSSVYRQDVGMPFELVMVDDGSTDRTYELMRRLAGQRTNIRLVRHTLNLGAGAARNTAVANGKGELIFCLDADDMLGDGFLENITRFWLRKRCDAVGMSTSIKFRGTNVRDVAYVSNYEVPGRRVRFESLFEGPHCSLDVVFLMTRAAFLRVGGYPTDYGLDNPGMGFRFLANGLTAYTCPDTVYYHRVEHHESMYLREQSQDRLNWNWFCLLDEFLYLFRPAVRAKILGSDLFNIPGKPAPGRLSDIVYGRRGIYAPNYKHLIRLGRDGVASRFSASRDGFQQYWVGAYSITKGRYEEAITHLQRALRAGFDYRIVYLRMMEASLRLSRRSTATPQALSELLEYSQPFPMQYRPFRHRLMHAALQNRWMGKIAAWFNSNWVVLRDRHARGNG